MLRAFLAVAAGLTLWGLVVTTVGLAVITRADAQMKPATAAACGIDGRAAEAAR